MMTIMATRWKEKNGIDHVISVESSIFMTRHCYMMTMIQNNSIAKNVILSVILGLLYITSRL